MSFRHGEIVMVAGRSLRLHTDLHPEEIAAAVKLLEQTLGDMEATTRIKWGSLQSGMDTTTMLLLGALNLAHRVAGLERDANLHTHNLEQTLSLLSDVPDEITGEFPYGAHN